MQDLKGLEFGLKKLKSFGLRHFNPDIKNHLSPLYQEKINEERVDI